MKKIFIFMITLSVLLISCSMPNNEPIYEDKPIYIYEEKPIYIYEENFDMLKQISSKLGRHISIDLFVHDAEENDVRNKEWILSYTKRSERYSVWFPEGNLKYLIDYTNNKKIEKMSDVAEFAIYLFDKYKTYGTGEPSYNVEKIGNTITDAYVMFGYDNYQEGTKQQIINDYNFLLKEGR